MKVVTRQEFIEHMNGYISQVKSGSVIIYPTDTIYGMGCNALLNKSVQKVRELKDNPQNPFSVIVPNKEWIYDNCIVPPEAESFIEQLPGPITIILPLKNDTLFSKDVSPNLDTIGIRLPDHYISTFVQKLGYPLITTSVNKKGRRWMISLENLDEDIQKGIDFIVYDGEIEGTPSKIVRFDQGQSVQISRDTK